MYRLITVVFFGNADLKKNKITCRYILTELVNKLGIYWLKFIFAFAFYYFLNLIPI